MSFKEDEANSDPTFGVAKILEEARELLDPDYKVRLRAYRKANYVKHWVDALKDTNEIIRLEARKALDKEK